MNGAYWFAEALDLPFTWGGGSGTGPWRRVGVSLPVSRGFENAGMSSEEA
jgi:hypothetical protein